MIKFNKALYLYSFSFLLLSSSLFAYTDDDIDGFLASGKSCYKLGRLDEAALEFENVLIIDKSNFQARLWLAQIYIDKKDIVNARKLLTEASIQVPDHPRVKELQKLIGESGDHVKQDLVDPVIAETIGGITKVRKPRKYGLVIPENKIIEENMEKKLLISVNQVFDEKKEIIENREKRQTENEEVNKKYFVSDNSNPLEPVFQAYRSQGLNKALDKYFELLAKDPSLASKDDKGIIDEGNKIYSVKYSEDPNNNENRYYQGMLLYVNGFYNESNEVLKPFRSNPGQYASRLRPYFTLLDKWLEQEKIRIAALKYEEEQRLAREAQEKAKAEADKNDVWNQVKNRGQDKNTDLALNKKEAEEIHNEAYKMYKKGKLDEAIGKFNEALAKDPNNPEYNYHLGLAWMDKGLAGDSKAYDKAIASYQRVIAIDPDNKLAQDAAAMIKDIRSAKRSLGEK